jgi:anti-sigma regulatory factor (Ser/Thr protein kinase)
MGIADTEMGSFAEVASGVLMPNQSPEHQPGGPNELPPPWTLKFEESSLALHRRGEFVEYLRTYGRGEDDYATAELIFDELVANVCFHAPGPIELLVEWHSGRAALHVTDVGAPIDMSRIGFPDPYAEGGRGLAIVNALSVTVRSATYLNGKKISAALPIWIAAA